MLVALAGGAVFLAEQPAGDVQPIPPSSAAAAIAGAKVLAAFKLAGVKAVLTRRAQPVSIDLSDLELTSIADLWLAAQPDPPVHDLTVRGTSGGVFQAAAVLDWNGTTFHVFEAGTVEIAGDGGVQPTASEARVGRLPLPAGLVNSLIGGGQPAFSKPSGVLDLSLQPVEGGGVLSGTVAPTSI